MKKWIRWIGWILGIPAALLLLVSLLLYVPPLQRFVVSQAVTYAEGVTGMQIRIGRIHLAFPLDLSVRQVEVIDAVQTDGTTSQPDTLVCWDELRLRIQAWPLLHRQVLIEAFEWKGLSVNSGTLLEDMSLRGEVGRFYAHVDRVNLPQEQATINRVELSDADLAFSMRSSTSEPDTVSEPLGWLLNLEQIRLDRVKLDLTMPDDSLHVALSLDQTQLEDGTVDLGASAYGVRRLQMDGSALEYDSDGREPAEGLDVAHVHLSNLQALLSDLFYSEQSLTATLERFSVEERSGLQVQSLTGRVRGDSLMLELPDWQFQLAHSGAQFSARIPWKLMDGHTSESMQLQMIASFGKEDLLMASGISSEVFHEAYPEQPLTLQADMSGNSRRMTLEQIQLDWSEVLQLRIEGEGQMLHDSIRRQGRLEGVLQTERIQFLTALLPASVRENYALPQGMSFRTDAVLAGDSCQASWQLTEGVGRVEGNASYHFASESYRMAMTLDSLQPQHFLPKDSLLELSASLWAEGQGLDPFVASTQAAWQADLTSLQYGSSRLSGIHCAGELQNQQLQVDFHTQDPLLRMDISLNAQLKERDYKAMLIADVEQVDLYALHGMDHPFSTAFQLFAEAESDGEEKHLVDVTLGNWEIQTQTGRYKPKTLTLHAHSDADTSRLSFHAGDLSILLTGDACVHELTEQMTKLSEEASKQFERDTLINLEQLRPLWPRLDLQLRAGQDNPVYNYLANYYVNFKSFALDASASPDGGLQMKSTLLELASDTFWIDSIQGSLWQDTLGLCYDLQAVKQRYRQQAPFRAGVGGVLRPSYADACFRYQDGQGDTGLLLGLRVNRMTDGWRFSLFPDEPIVAFRPFVLNPDNYIYWQDARSIAADMRLSGENYASLWIHSEEEEGMEYDPVHVELSQIDLSVLSKAFAYLPSMGGMLNANLQYAPADSGFMVVADTHIDELFYERKRVGELFLNTVYLPLAEGEHQVDAHLFRDRQEISTLTVLYRTNGTEDSINGSLSFLHLPLQMADPFIPDDMARMQGDLDGELLISGTSSAPQTNGYLMLDSASVFVGALGSSFRFDGQRVPIRNNRLYFNQYKCYAYGENPLVLEGVVDLNDPSNLQADLKMNADELQVFQVKRNDESLVYGKMFVNLRSTLKGPLEALTMRGDLQILGTTDVTYVMQDSPVTVQDRLADMVTFVSFADSVRRKLPRKPPLPLGGLDLLMTVRVDPAVRCNVDLTPDQSSHVNLEGGGDLSFQYTPQGDMLLNGRYTLTGGTFKYALPVIPLKEFTIQEGSYVQWNGPVMNPVLNLTATERVRASVNSDGSARSVNFDVGVELKDRLETPALQFVLNAPEDRAMEDELNAKGTEERAKLAVSMLVTGMYLGSSSNGKVNMNMGTALNNFLQNEINNIAGSALKSVDLSFGMDSYDENGSEGGGSRTDYSFRFAKRFYNDRIRVILGGRISTGENINNGQAQPFIDNVSVEYRLDDSGSRYVKLFHNKNYESLLEGEITETGAGVVLRRKMRYLRELFTFKKKTAAVVNRSVGEEVNDEVVE